MAAVEEALATVWAMPQPWRKSEALVVMGELSTLPDAAAIERLLGADAIMAPETRAWLQDMRDEVLAFAAQRGDPKRLRRSAW